MCVRAHLRVGVEWNKMWVNNYLRTLLYFIHEAWSEAPCRTKSNHTKYIVKVNIYVVVNILLSTHITGKTYLTNWYQLADIIQARLI